MTFKLGDTSINKLFLGGTEIKRAYLGATEIFDSTVAPSATISYVSGANTTYASRTNTTVTAPSGIQNGDVLLANFFQGQSSSYPAAPTAPAGWTQIGSAMDMTDTGFFARVYNYIKVASGESGDYTWTHGSRSSQGAIAVYRGVNTTTPQDAISTANTGNVGPTRTWTGLTTVADNAWIVAMGCDWADLTNNLTPPTGMTERLDVTLSYIADQEIASAGATGNRSHTCNSIAANPADHPWAARLIALRPA